MKTLERELSRCDISDECEDLERIVEGVDAPLVNASNAALCEKSEGKKCFLSLEAGEWLDARVKADREGDEGAF